MLAVFKMILFQIMNIACILNCWKRRRRLALLCSAGVNKDLDISPSDCSVRPVRPAQWSAAAAVVPDDLDIAKDVRLALISGGRDLPSHPARNPPVSH